MARSAQRRQAPTVVRERALFFLLLRRSADWGQRWLVTLLFCAWRARGLDRCARARRKLRMVGYRFCCSLYERRLRTTVLSVWRSHVWQSAKLSCSQHIHPPLDPTAPPFHPALPPFGPLLPPLHFDLPAVHADLLTADADLPTFDPPPLPWDLLPFHPPPPSPFGPDLPPFDPDLPSLPPPPPPFDSTICWGGWPRGQTFPPAPPGLQQGHRQDGAPSPGG